MATFKLGETARRLRVLAENATDARVRSALIEASGTLLSEQRDLERESRTAKRSNQPSDLEERWPPLRRVG